MHQVGPEGPQPLLYVCPACSPTPFPASCVRAVPYELILTRKVLCKKTIFTLLLLLCGLPLSDQDFMPLRWYWDYDKDLSPINLPEPTKPLSISYAVFST